MMPSVLSSEHPELPERRRSVRGVSLFVRSQVLDFVTDHADLGLLDGKEVMGLLVGRVYRDGDGVYAVAERVITGDLDADSVSVRFDPASADGLIDSVDAMEEDERVVGWYHSHLGAGCYMSQTDISTQDRMFGGDLGFALVVDPEKGEMAVFDSTVGGPRTADMIIMSDD